MVAAVAGCGSQAAPPPVTVTATPSSATPKPTPSPTKTKPSQEQVFLAQTCESVRADAITVSHDSAAGSGQAELIAITGVSLVEDNRKAHLAGTLPLPEPGQYSNLLVCRGTGEPSTGDPVGILYGYKVNANGDGMVFYEPESESQ